MSDSSDSARRGLDAFNQRGSEGLVEFLAEEAHPAFIFHIQDDLLNGGVWEGIEGTRSMMSQWLEPWDEFEVTAREFIDGAGDRLLIRVEQRAVATATGMEIRGDFHYVWVYDGGKVREIHLFADPSQARQEAGIGD